MSWAGMSRICCVVVGFGVESDSRECLLGPNMRIRLCLGNSCGDASWVRRDLYALMPFSVLVELWVGLETHNRCAGASGLADKTCPLGFYTFVPP